MQRMDFDVEQFARFRTVAFFRRLCKKMRKRQEVPSDGIMTAAAILDVCKKHDRDGMYRCERDFMGCPRPLRWHSFF